MEKILQKFLRLKTVTGPSSQSQLAMWQGARFLENLIEDLGGEGRIVPGEEGISPVVLGRFQNVLFFKIPKKMKGNTISFPFLYTLNSSNLMKLMKLKQTY